MSHPREHESDRGVWAYLGPTNTGKTHRAIERMLEHGSGMMGLPLRLLAREVYERVSTRLGEQAVALVTGEEKRVPARPRYWVCTVEAMPRELAVEFLAIDEIQLIAHPERGHVFTDRLLHWRGTAETWFLGAAATERLLRALVPELRVRHLPRLSQLSYTGQSSLRTLPRRSATVAFSLPQVYELADALRARRGGAAVVLGALSPRVRNAQVALYQAGEVDFLVATDAIGMGLNLDIEHVAMSGRTKFDGFEVRELETGELAQIVGRAGRHLRDGTFGTLAPEPELSRTLVEQLEQHRFPALRFAYYRNAELDLTSVPALLASLERRPGRTGLVAPPDGDDLLVLRVLAEKPEVTNLATTSERVAALWNVCRIPNYEKRIPEHQADRLVPLFDALAREGELSPELVDRELSRLARFEGDIHQLMDRLSAVRTWTYVSHQAGWVPGAEAFQERTRALEDRLGDLLHERLLERFVARPNAKSRPRASELAQRAQDAHSPFAKLAELDMYAAEEKSAERGRQRWCDELVEAPFAELALNSTGDVFFRDERVARLTAGAQLARPQLRPMLPDWVPPGSRGRIERRLLAHGKDLVAHLFEPLALPEESPTVRGLVYQLSQGLGTVSRRAAEEQVRALTDAERALLEAHQVVLGQRSVFARGCLSEERRTLRLVLSTLVASDPRAFRARARDADHALVLANVRALGPEALLALGFVPVAEHAVRCDVLERLLTVREREGAGEAQRELEALVGGDQELAQAIATGLTRKRRRRRR